MSFIYIMNNTLINLYQSSIKKFIINNISNIDDNNKLFFICKFDNQGLKFPDNNKLNLKDFTVRDNVLSIINSNKQFFDKRMQELLFNNKLIDNENDLAYYKLIIFSLLFNFSKMKFNYILNDELYVSNN